MRTKQLIGASCLTASLLVVGVGCSSSGDGGSATPTTVVSKSSDGGGVTTSAPAGPDDEEVALPSKWPEELALPDGLVPITANDLGDTAAVVVARVDGDPEATLEAFESQLKDADWEIVTSNFTDSPEGGFGGVSARGRKYTVAIVLGPAPTGDTTEVTVNLAEKTSE